jgi:hypothetical protein
MLIAVAWSIRYYNVHFTKGETDTQSSWLAQKVSCRAEQKQQFGAQTCTFNLSHCRMEPSVKAHFCKFPTEEDPPAEEVW